MGISRRLLVPLAAGLLAGVACLVALHAWRDVGYWNYSEGVYALTSRLLLDGEDLYGDIVVAQPPVIFLLGAGFLALEDSITWLRLGLGLVQLATALLAGLVVWRLTGRAWASGLTVPLAMLTPWAVHEHGLLTPELVGAPLLLGGALLAARSRLAIPAAAVLSVAVFTKVPLLLPAVLAAAAAQDRRRCLAWLAGFAVVQAALWTVVFGASLWQDVLLAQQATGLRAMKPFAEYGSQGAWNLLGLLVPAAAALLLFRHRARDRALLNTTAALAVGLLGTLLTMLKNGTSINVLVPVEAGLVVLAVCGAVWAFEERRSTLLRGAVGAGALLLALQSASLFTHPTDPRPFLRPGASGLGPALQSEDVRREEVRARRCPPRLPYSGPPYLAFVAERRMPASQPDGFLTLESSRLTDVLERVEADRPRCP